MLSLSDDTFAAMAAILRDETGIQIDPQRAAMVEARVGRRLRQLGIADDFDRYRALLEEGGDLADGERRAFVNVMTTNVTGFFREGHHFDLLAAHVAARRRAAPGAPVAVWSAGCASGAEAVSAVLAIAAACPDMPPDALSVVATDIDDGAVEAARTGFYDPDLLAADAASRYAALLCADDRGRVGLAPPWRARVRAARHNLVGGAPIPNAPPGGFDAILCRNVVIYFAEPAKRAAQSALDGALRPGGLLMLGHSERLLLPMAASYERIGLTAFRRGGTI